MYLINDRPVKFILRDELMRKKNGKIENWRKHSYYFPRKITKPFSRVKIHFLLVIFHFAFSTNGLSFGPTNIRAIFYFLLLFFFFYLLNRELANTLFIHLDAPREILQKNFIIFFFHIFHPDEIVRTVRRKRSHNFNFSPVLLALP